MLQNLKNKLKDNKGFSLVELIVVIAIMVILIALLVPQVSGYIRKAADASGESAAKAAYTAGVQIISDAAANGTPVAGDGMITKDTATGKNANNISASGKGSICTDSSTDATESTFQEDYLPNLKGDAAIQVQVKEGKVIKAVYAEKESDIPSSWETKTSSDDGYGKTFYVYPAN